MFRGFGIWDLEKRLKSGLGCCRVDIKRGSLNFLNIILNVFISYFLSFSDWEKIIAGYSLCFSKTLILVFSFS